MLQGKMFVEAYLWLWGWFFWPDRDLQANWQVKGLLGRSTMAGCLRLTLMLGKVTFARRVVIKCTFWRLCQEDVSGWSCISCLYPVEEDLLDKILDSLFSGCWWQSRQMETISMLRCLVIIGLERSSSLEGVPGCVKESAPRRLCCWVVKGQGLDVELIIPVLDMQRLGLWCGSLHYHAGSRLLRL